MLLLIAVKQTINKAAIFNVITTLKLMSTNSIDHLINVDGRNSCDLTINLMIKFNVEARL
jgi:hypothetical protein